MLNDILMEIYHRAEELEKTDFFPKDTDWQAIMDNISMSLLEDDIRAIKFVRVCNGEIIEP